MWRLAFVVACYQSVTLAPDDGSATPIDGPPLVGDGSGDCVGGAPGFVQVCGLANAMPRTVSGSIDTDSTCDQEPPGLCVYTGSTVTIQGVVASGGRPLVIAARDTLTVAQTAVLFVGTEASPGPASGTFSGCTAFQRPGLGGGGAGGAFQGTGGNGEQGNGFSGAVGGVASATVPMTLVGGCDGGGASTSGAGGKGGGAVYLVAGNLIDVKGTVDAGGGGGDGGETMNGGGAGGGAGGMIVVHAPQIRIDGKLVANGGSGGGGADSQNNGTIGKHDGTAGTIGGGMAGGGTAGAGFASSGTGSLAGGGAGAGATAPAGGGGGGGGAGYILAFSSDPSIAAPLNTFPNPIVFK